MTGSVSALRQPFASLEGRTAVVTGAARGIGLAIAEAFLGVGATLLILDRDADALQDAVAELQGVGRAVGVACNMSTDDDLPRIGQALATLPTLATWVNNAGVVNHQAAEASDPTTFERIMRDNAASVLRGSRVAFEQMRAGGGGAIVNIASLAVDKVLPDRLTYAASKSAVISMTRYMAQEWGTHGVRVNAISPGYIQTRLTTWAADDPREIAKHETMARIAAKRVGQPREIAQVALFLASDLASYVTGEVVHVDGGWQLT